MAQKQFLLELADLMDKYGVKDLELTEEQERESYPISLGVDVNFSNYDIIVFEDFKFITPTDLRQKAEEL